MPLEIANVVGVFYVLSSGVTVAMFLAFLVVVLETLKMAKEMKVRAIAEIQKTGLISSSFRFNDPLQNRFYYNASSPISFE